ncbi:ArdC family protein [Gimesia sp.]|uniref:ArdC family protein n=1 Tax=Gimesia sp. TaxID=2024833 RepID=UPI003A8D19A6
MPSQTELRQQITNEIIKSLQQGIAPWKQPWSSDPCCGRPTNAVTKKPYNGINVLLLGMHNRDHMSHGKFFATYKQWQSIGGQVMARPSGVPKGKWGAKVVLYKPISKTKTNRKGEEVEDNYCVMRQFTVFNINQVEGDHLDHLRVGFCDNTDPEVSFREADELISNTGAGIMHGGNKAFYDPAIDVIQMPHKHQFDGPAYYETLFHELCHWTEHPDRLDWDRSKEGNSYAMGELIAEMSSCFVCSELGIPLTEGLDNHAAYLGHWLMALESDPSFIFRASTQASKVTDYLLSFSPTHAEEYEPLIVV